MKKILFVLGILTASFAQAKTMDVSKLNEIGQQLHRVGYCHGLQYWNLDKLDFKYEGKLIIEIKDLMISNGFLNTRNTVYRGAREDITTQLILGEIDLKQSIFNECTEDMKKILKKTYVPNFSYMEQ